VKEKKAEKSLIKRKEKREDTLLSVVSTNIVIFFAVSTTLLLSIAFASVLVSLVFLFVLVLGISGMIVTTDKIESKQPAKMSKSLTAAGILTIFSACCCLVVGYIETSLSTASSTLGISISFDLFMLGMLSVAAFVFGATAGALVFRKRLLPLFVGSMVAALVSSIGTLALPYSKTLTILLLAVPILVPTIASVIAVATSRKEFTD
jgi:hypothetical protein